MVTTTEQNKHIKCILWVNDTRYVRFKLKYFIRKQIETFSEIRQKSLECHSQDQESCFFFSLPSTEILSIELIAIIIIIVVLVFVGIRLSGPMMCNLRSAAENRNNNKKISKQNKNIILITIITLHILLWHRLDVTQQQQNSCHRNGQVFTWPLSLFINISNRFIYTLAQFMCASRCVPFYWRAVIYDYVETQFGSKLLSFCSKCCCFCCCHYYIYGIFNIHRCHPHKYCVCIHTYTRNVWRHSAWGKTARQTQFDWISLWHIVLS